MSMNELMRERMLHVLDDTVDHFRTHPRAFVVNIGLRKVCKYFTSDGRHCAVGRYMEDPAEYMEHDGGVWSLAKFVDGRESIDHVLRPAYWGLPVSFWQKIQGLHDDEDAWERPTGGELTAEGRYSESCLRDDILYGNLEDD